MSKTYHVAKTGAAGNKGTLANPFLTISMAAQVAMSGDTIIVHEGEYREWVKPQNGGLSDTRRITYMVAEGEHAVIKGSERIQSWESLGGGVWKAVLPNAMFGEFNPYKEIIEGDWMVYPIGRSVHLGDVYLNGMSFYEAENLDGVHHPVTKTEMLDDWTNEIIPVKNPEQTKYRWYATVDAESTVLYANFHKANPNKELVEVNVRKCCFYPAHIGVNYITVRGFEMAHSANPWATPTGDQPGMLGTHWSRGWIIENNIFHDAKCSAVSIGKEASTGDNWRTFRKDKPGYQYQLEVVFTALKAGWSKEKIGSHIIRNNTMYDCGQNGVVGHLGCVFSEISGNHIYNIAQKREFYGYEIAGIKLHAAIDVQILNNRIHDCSLGTWLDWQAQGTRASRNLFYNNNSDLFIEVSHGPYIVDHNVFGSKRSLDNHAQGGAYVHNLFAGKIDRKKMLNRATPYHAPHSTDVIGYAMVYGGDDRMFQNLFIGGKAMDSVGTDGYNPCTTSLEEYIEQVDAIVPGDLEIFEKVEQPAYVNCNAYLSGAKAFDREAEKLLLPDFDAEYSVEEKDGTVYLNLTLPQGFDAFVSDSHTTETLRRIRIVDADFENPDGSPLTINCDYSGTVALKAVAGPLYGLKPGKNRVILWT